MIRVPFTVGRVDATQDDTDIANFENLNPQGDGFRNYRNSSGWSLARTEELLVDKAQQLLHQELSWKDISQGLIAPS